MPSFKKSECTVENLAINMIDLNLTRYSHLILYARYPLIDMAKIAFPSEVDTNSTIKLQQLTASAKDQVLKKAKIPSKFWPLLRNLNKVCDSDNDVCRFD